MSLRPTRRAVLLSGVALAVFRPVSAGAAAIDDAAALNALLATEHAVIYDLAAAGATLPVPGRAMVLAHYDEHRARRDLLVQRIHALGGTPVAALPAYADPDPAAYGNADIVVVERAAVRAYHGAIAVVGDASARALCVPAFVAEARHLALALAATGRAGAPSAFVTGD